MEKKLHVAINVAFYVPMSTDVHLKWLYTLWPACMPWTANCKHFHHERSLCTLYIKGLPVHLSYFAVSAKSKCKLQNTTVIRKTFAKHHNQLDKVQYEPTMFSYRKPRIILDCSISILLPDNNASPSLVFTSASVVHNAPRHWREMEILKRCNLT